LPRRGSRKARDTWVQIRYAQVTLSAPEKLTSQTSVKAWAVYVSEEDPVEDTSPIEWMLITTVPVDTFQDAQKRVEWYSARWGIELYYRTLKSGCKIKNRQLGTADSIQTCLGIDMVVAWRIYHLTMLGRETPQAPCNVFFSDIEWKALCCYVKKTPNPPENPPNLSEAVSMVAKMGWIYRFNYLY